MLTSQRADAQVFKTIPAGPLRLQVYSAAEPGLYVASTIVMGHREAILIDAQYTLTDAEKVVAELKKSGKTLKAIYISHGDPDYYFGLPAFKAAFPRVVVYASAPTVALILRTAQHKLDYWGPIMGPAIANNVVLPQVLKTDFLELEGHRLEIKGLDGADADYSFVWIPDAKAIVGGVRLFSGLHLWTTDVATPGRKADWRAKLALMEALQPAIVIPGHLLDNNVLDASIIAYTKKYLADYEAELGKAANSAALIAAMKARYPQAGLLVGLEIGAKVNTGEMQF
nr:MBL fold metallo-hydrolase [Hymenobacter terricola]